MLPNEQYELVAEGSASYKMQMKTRLTCFNKYDFIFFNTATFVGLGIVCAFFASIAVEWLLTIHYQVLYRTRLLIPYLSPNSVEFTFIIHWD